MIMPHQKIKKRKRKTDTKFITFSIKQKFSSFKMRKYSYLDMHWMSYSIVGMRNSIMKYVCGPQPLPCSLFRKLQINKLRIKCMTD